MREETSADGDRSASVRYQVSADLKERGYEVRGVDCRRKDVGSEMRDHKLQVA